MLLVVNRDNRTREHIALRSMFAARKRAFVDLLKWDLPILAGPFELDQFDDDPDILRLITLRSNDQFNTTIYGDTDRLRGIHGSRMIVMMSRVDRERFGIPEGGKARLISAAGDGIRRSMDGFQVIDYDIPQGTCAAYYPECNPLIPLWQHAEESKTPAAKSVPVRVEPVF